MSDLGDQFDPQASRLPPVPGPYPPPGRRCDHAPLDDDLLERFFDRQLDEADRRRLFAGLRADPQRAHEVVQTQQMLAQLDEPIVGPDLVGPVLRQIDAQQPFLSRGWRRVVTTGRVLVAACVLMTVAGVALLERYAPQLTLAERPAPVSSVVDSSQHAVVHDMDAIVRAGRSLLADKPRARRTHAVSEVAASDLARLRSELVSTGQGLSYEIGIDDHDQIARVWTTDDRDLTAGLTGSGAWRASTAAWPTTPTTPISPARPMTISASVVFVGRSGSQSVSMPMTISISAIGRDAFASAGAFVVDADPYTMRLRSSCGVEPTMATLVTTTRRATIDEDDDARGLRLVRVGRPHSSSRR